MNAVQQSSVLAAQTVWPVDRIKDHVVKIGSGITPSGGAASYLDSGVPLLRSQNVHFEGLRLEDVAYIAKETHDEMNGTKLRARDVLLNITGASIGRCAFVPDGFGEGNVNQHVCILRPAATLNYKFNGGGFFVHPLDGGHETARVFVTQSGVRSVRFL